MQLLPAEKVKSNDNRKAEELRAGIDKLNREEADVIKRVNLIKEEEATARNNMQTALSTMEVQFLERKMALESEVATLEERKKEAMRPVDEILARAQKREDAVALRESALTQKESEVKEQRNGLVERLQEVSDREQLCAEKEADLIKRETKIKSAEEEIAKSTIGLSDKWVEYHGAVHASNERIARREKEIEDREKVIETKQGEQEKRQKEQDERDVRLKDWSATLEASAQEILEKKQH